MERRFRWPIVGRCLTWFGAWPLALEGSDPAAIRRSLQWLRDGGAVVIFPEGGRSTCNWFAREIQGWCSAIGAGSEGADTSGDDQRWKSSLAQGLEISALGKVVVTYHPLYHAEPCSG